MVKKDWSNQEVAQLLKNVVAAKIIKKEDKFTVIAYQRAAFSINELKVIEGSLPKRIISLVLEWAFEHRDELLEDWQLVQKREELKKIDPLV